MAVITYVNDTGMIRVQDTGRGHLGSVTASVQADTSAAALFDSTNLLRQMAAAREAGAGADPGPSERSTSEMRPRLHSFGGAGAFRCAPSEHRAPAPVDARPFGG